MLRDRLLFQPANVCVDCDTTETCVVEQCLLFCEKALALSSACLSSDLVHVQHVLCLVWNLLVDMLDLRFKIIQSFTVREASKLVAQTRIDVWHPVCPEWCGDCVIVTEIDELDLHEEGEKLCCKRGQWTQPFDKASGCGSSRKKNSTCGQVVGLSASRQSDTGTSKSGLFWAVRGIYTSIARCAFPWTLDNTPLEEESACRRMKEEDRLGHRRRKKTDRMCSEEAFTGVPSHVVSCVPNGVRGRLGVEFAASGG